MEIRVLLRGMGGTFRTSGPLVTQVIFDTVEGFRLARCDFPTAEDEREFLAAQEHLPMVDRIEMLSHMGGSGRITLLEDDSGARIELYGAVRALAPALREMADAFEARLAELPT